MAGFLRLLLASVLVFSTLAPAATADDLAERRKLVAELVGIVPYSDADAEREMADGLIAALRKAYPAGMTPYAEQEARAAVIAAWRKHPSISRMIVDLLETRLTTDELKAAIAFTRSPVALKIRANPPLPGEAEIAQFQRVLNADEQAEFIRMMQQPGMKKYLAVLQEAATPIGKAVGEDMVVELKARCAAPKQPLPWC